MIETKMISTALKLMGTSNQKQRAELFYILAILHAKEKLIYVAQGYARECIRVLNQVGTNTLEDCATSCMCFEGICLPDFLHEQVIRNNLGYYNIRL